MPLQIKRIYEAVLPQDGKRILIDRLWPRGVSKERASLNEWFKDIVPSPTLRKSFSHKEEYFEKFSQDYLYELQNIPQKQKLCQQLLLWSKEGMVTLLYAAKSPTINHAVVLLHFLQNPPN